MKLKELWYSEYDLKENKSVNTEIISDPSSKLVLRKLKALDFDLRNEITIIIDNVLSEHGSLRIRSCKQNRLHIYFNVTWMSNKSTETRFLGTLVDPDLVNANHMATLYDARFKDNLEEYDEIYEKYAIETSDPAQVLTIDLTVEEEYGWTVCEYFILNGKFPFYVTFRTRQDKLSDYQKFRDYWVELG